MKKIAFNTANLVGRVSDYKFSLKQWGDQHKRTAAETDAKEWAKICREVANAGYTAMEVWVAHVDPSTTDEKKAREFGRIMADHGLAPVALAGTLNDANAKICQWLNIPRCSGGFWGSDLPTVRRLVKDTGIDFNYENHPEKAVEDIVKAIEGGGQGIGVAVDTGWLCTQGIDAPAAIRKLGKLIKHVHLKEVKAGTHETAPLGTGGVNIEGVINALKEIGFTGWYSWEDEPENRNPMDIAAEMRRWIEARI
jgi:L-ribulose-5-phosphate 3-epimerase